MLDHPESFLLEVAVIHEDNVFPMVPQGKGVAEIVLVKKKSKIINDETGIYINRLY